MRIRYIEIEEGGRGGVGEEVHREEGGCRVQQNTGHCHAQITRVHTCTCLNMHTQTTTSTSTPFTHTI